MKKNPGTERDHQEMNDLRHFLSLAEAQLGNRLAKAAAMQPFSGGINRMHLLHELIKEQIPRDGTSHLSESQLGTDSPAKDPRSPAGSSR